MAVTTANARYNLRTAAGRVASRLGVDPQNMTYDERRAYTAALAAEVLAYPASFTPEILAIAERIRDPGPLVDDSFSWGAYADEVATAAPGVLGEFTNKLLWILALGLVAWIFFNHRPSGPSPVRA